MNISMDVGIVQEIALSWAGKRQPAAIKLERVTLETGYEMRPGRIDALKYTVELAYTRVWIAREEKLSSSCENRARSFARSLARRFCALEITMQIRFLAGSYRGLTTTKPKFWLRRR